MAQVTVQRHIAAPVDRVFQAVAHIENFAKAVPQISNVEFLTESHVGVGTRFRETRVMHGKEASTELEVTEYEPNDRVRLVADSHGTVWDTVFTVKPANGGTDLEMVMDAKAYKLLAKLMNPLVCRMISKYVAADMDAVKAYCEGDSDDATQSTSV